jgi:hypothetical protein
MKNTPDALILPCELIIGNVLPIILIEGSVFVPGDKEDHAIGTAVVHRSQTHRAGMREDIERTAEEMFRVQLARCFSDRTDLGVRGRIMRLGHPVHTFRQHHTVLNNKAGKWPSTGLHIPFSPDQPAAP